MLPEISKFFSSAQSVFIDKIRQPRLLQFRVARVEADLFLDSTPVTTGRLESNKRIHAHKNSQKVGFWLVQGIVRGREIELRAEPSRHRPFAKSDPAVAGSILDSAQRIKLVLSASYSFQKVGVIAIRQPPDEKSEIVDRIFVRSP